jgi:hypothetical protein
MLEMKILILMALFSSMMVTTVTPRAEASIPYQLHTTTTYDNAE